MGLEFNFPSFGIGAGAGILSTLAVQRILKILKEQQSNTPTEESEEDKLSGTRKSHRRYTADLLQFCQTSHLLGKQISLKTLLIEPRFIPFPEAIQPPSPDNFRDVFDDIPLYPDFPKSHAPFNLRTLDIEELGKGHKQIVIIGAQGTGKTTALQAIALWSMGQLRFVVPDDVVAKRIADEEKELKAEERAERVKRRVLVAQQAREQYRAFMGRSGDEEPKKKEPQSLKQYAPLYAHFANIKLDTSKDQTLDPAEPLMRALQAHVSPLAARLMPQTLYKLLTNGRALVLLDGINDIPSDEVAQKLAWLNAFTKAYSHNFIIVTSPPVGYQPYVEMGYAPIMIRAWTDTQTQSYIEKIIANWKQISGKTLTPSDAQITHIQKKTRLLTPFEMTLHIWTALLGDLGNESHQIHAYLKSLLSGTDELLPTLQEIATIQLNEGYILPSRLVDSMLTEEESETVATDEKALQQSLKKAQTEVNRLLKRLTQNKILVRLRGGRYRFHTRQIAYYLAATRLSDSPIDTLFELNTHPDWQSALAFANQHTSLDALVSASLVDTEDIRYSGVMRLLDWLKYGGTSVSWRNALLRLVGNLLVAPHQYAVIRERLAFALLASGDESVLIVFRKMLQNGSSDLRRIGCLGLGWLKDEEAIRPISELAMGDTDPNVQLAAVFGLGAIGTENALMSLVDVLEISTNNDVQRAIAETLAMFPETGYPTLYDAIRAEPLMVRRAAVWGLGRVKTDWSLITLNEVYLTDDEWYVRSASAQVFEDVYEEGKQGARTYPSLDNVTWLNQWIQEQTDIGAVTSNLRGMGKLRHALQQREDALIRLLAIILVGQLGVTEVADLLYNALYDTEEVIRDGAYRSLHDLQTQHNVRLQSPVAL